MKKILLIISLISVILLVGCLEKIEIGPAKNESSESKIEETQKIQYSFDEYLGTDKDGGQIKYLFNEIIKTNDSLSGDDKISVELNALRGKVGATSDKEQLQKMQGYIGNSFSLYNVTYSGDTISGKITSIYIEQTVGTKDDPEIPYEVPEQELLINYMPSENPQ